MNSLSYLKVSIGSLDALSTSKEYSSYGRNKDQKIMEIKNNAAKKIKEGGRISLDELRLLYDK